MSRGELLWSTIQICSIAIRNQKKFGALFRVLQKLISKQILHRIAITKSEWFTLFYSKWKSELYHKMAPSNISVGEDRI